MSALVRVEALSGVRRATVDVLVNVQAVPPSQKPGHVSDDLELAIRFSKTDDSFDRAPRRGRKL